MTPQYILRRSLCRKPSCFSSHVPGKGYVGTLETEGAEFVRQYVRAAESEIENLQWADGYAEPGYTDPARGVLFANWNRFPRGVDSILKRAGYAIEWSDEWSTCEECGKAVRTSPDSYAYRPHYREDLIEHGTFICLDCSPAPVIDPEGETIERDETDRLIGLSYACERFHGGQTSQGYRLMCAIDWKPGTDRAARLADRDEWSEARRWAAHYIRLARRQPNLF
jgi:hypothetical protein